MLAERYPDIRVDRSVLYVDNGQILTSAGASSGIDLCLHLIRRDHGQAVAATVARLAVAPLDREGGHAQFIQYEVPGSSSNLAPLLAWIDKHSHQSLTITILAARAAMSTRTFIRRFKEQTGTTPLQWILFSRIRHAQQLLETSQLSIDADQQRVVVRRRHVRGSFGVFPERSLVKMHFRTSPESNCARKTSCFR